MPVSHRLVVRSTATGTQRPLLWDRVLNDRLLPDCKTGSGGLRGEHHDADAGIAVALLRRYGRLGLLRGMPWAHMG